MNLHTEQALGTLAILYERFEQVSKDLGKKVLRDALDGQKRPQFFFFRSRRPVQLVWTTIGCPGIVTSPKMA